jgi:hypothetical protein
MILFASIGTNEMVDGVLLNTSVAVFYLFLFYANYVSNGIEI